MKIADIAMYTVFVIAAVLIVFCCVAIINSIRDTKKNNFIRENGIISDAIIVKVHQEDVQNIEGWLQLIVTVKYKDIQNKEIQAIKDIGVKNILSNQFQVGSHLQIKYVPERSGDIIVLHEGAKN
ncbi:hypothetical protein [Paramixta manurensis]